MGNIIRSPLAEALFNHYIADRGLQAEYQADSAGTDSWHVGEEPDSRMRQTAAQYGLTYTHQARQFHPSDFESFDLIIAMDASNKADILELARSSDYRKKVRLMRDFDPLEGAGRAVPDPYYGGQQGFEITYSIIDRSVKTLIAALQDDSI
jgi:protein-tyrosine phosphatase